MTYGLFQNIQKCYSCFDTLIVEGQTTYFDESLGVEVYMTKTNDDLSEDVIYLDKTNKWIQFIILVAIGISLTAFVSLLFWLDSIEKIIIRYV